METKFNIIGWSLVVIGALIIIFSFIFMQHSPEMCSTPTIGSSFLTFGVGIALMMIGFAKLYADEYNKR
jgi:predicted phage tail protein